MFRQTTIHRLKLAFVIVILCAGVWGGYRCWQYVYRLPVDNATVFRKTLSVHTIVRQGLNVMLTDISVPNNTNGDLVFRLRPVASVTNNLPSALSFRPGRAPLSVIDLNKSVTHNGWLAWFIIAVL